jgi:hypothetical protein
MISDDFSLRDLADPPAASYAAVRLRVLGEIRRQRRVRNAVRMLAAVAACVVLAVAGLLALRHTAATSGLPMLARTAEAPPLVAPAQIEHNRPKPKRHGVRLLAHAPVQPLVVRMQTDDPNVVIIWIAD